MLDRKAVISCIIWLALVIVTLIFSTSIGSTFIQPWSVVKVILGLGSQSEVLLIHHIRLPRIVVALLVGAALAAAGAILQSMIRNPLASPDLIGITGGASAAAVAFITLFPTLGIHWLPLAAMLGAIIITIIIYFFAWKGGISPLRLVLIGVGMNAAMNALTTMLIVKSPIFLTSRALIWLTGSVYGSNWTHVYALLPWVIVFIPAAWAMSRTVNIMQLGDDVATGTGSSIQRHRFLLIAICVALAGSAVAIGGAISFVGLIAPHIARRLVGSSFGALLPLSVFIGACTVAWADLIGRTVFIPLSVPVGVFTAVIGAPFFIYLLYKNRNM